MLDLYFFLHQFLQIICQKQALHLVIWSRKRALSQYYDIGCHDIHCSHLKLRPRPPCSAGPTGQRLWLGSEHFTSCETQSDISHSIISNLKSHTQTHIALKIHHSVVSLIWWGLIYPTVMQAFKGIFTAFTHISTCAVPHSWLLKLGSMLCRAESES